MDRTAMKQLEAWKTSRNRKPLIIRGARQTGKTWLSEEFGRTRYEAVARIDLMNNERARSFFDGDLDVSRILRNISLETGVPITADTLVLLDEIQECPRALTALKYFCEDARAYHVIATGSYMGIARHEDTSYPVGKVDTLTLRPMDFTEYLRAIGQGMMADAMSDGASIADLDSGFRDRLKDWLKEYMVVGGMPAVVADFAEHHDFNEARKLQRFLMIMTGTSRNMRRYVSLREFVWFGLLYHRSWQRRIESSYTVPCGPAHALGNSKKAFSGFAIMEPLQKFQR